MQNFDHNFGFWEKRHFFAENCRKSQKIVIITSTPGHHVGCEKNLVIEFLQKKSIERFKPRQSIKPSADGPNDPTPYPEQLALTPVTKDTKALWFSPLSQDKSFRTFNELVFLLKLPKQNSIYLHEKSLLAVPFQPDWNRQLTLVILPRSCFSEVRVEF
jgi:hypothetical protein